MTDSVTRFTGLPLFLSLLAPPPIKPLPSAHQLLCVDVAICQPAGGASPQSVLLYCNNPCYRANPIGIAPVGVADPPHPQSVLSTISPQSPHYRASPVSPVGVTDSPDTKIDLRCGSGHWPSRLKRERVTHRRSRCPPTLERPPVLDRAPALDHWPCRQ